MCSYTNLYVNSNGVEASFTLILKTNYSESPIFFNSVSCIMAKIVEFNLI